MGGLSGGPGAKAMEPCPMFMEFMEPTAHHASSREAWRRAQIKQEGTPLLVAA